MKDSLECYKVLGIEPGAAPERVRNAYLQLARFYDPDRYAEGDPDQREKAEKKRQEVEEAYQGIKHFLPALQGDQDSSEKMDQDRDFQEMVDKGPSDVFKTIAGIIMGIVLILILAWGYSLYRKTRQLPPAPTVSVDPESAANPGSSTH